jgi:hypothetical protein
MSVARRAPRGRKIAAALGLTCAAMLFGGAPSASAALFNQCPPIGLDDGCGVLITVNPDGTGKVETDPAQPPYEGDEDAMVGLQNNFAGTVTSVDLASTLDIFGFDGDGLCTQTGAPAGCPFGPTGYEGPTTSFSNINTVDFTSGTVNFSPAVPSGGSAYWSLEEAITAADINLGTIALIQPPPPEPVKPAPCGTVSASANGYRPKKSLNPTIPGVRAFINVSEPSQVDVDASLSVGASKAKSTKLGSFTLQDPGRKKLRIPLPASLRDELSFGDRVTLNLSIKTTPNAAPRCASTTATHVSLKTRVVHILKREHN